MAWSSGGGGGAASTLPAGYDAEVEASGDVQAALTSNDNVYVSGAVSTTTKTSITAEKSIKYLRGITHTFAAGVGSNAGFEISAGIDLNIHCEDEFTLTAAHTGLMFLGLGNAGGLNVTGTMVLDITSGGNLITGLGS